MKVWKIALVSVLALGLVLGMASPALAAPPWASPPSADPPPPRVIRGEVVSIEDNTAFIVQFGWYEVRVSVSSDTEYFKAPLPRKCSPFAPHLLEPPEPCPRGLGLMERLHRLAGRALAPLKIPALVRNRIELKVAELPPPCGEEATFDDIEVGSRVIVWAVPDEDNPLAERVVIIEPAA